MVNVDYNKKTTTNAQLQITLNIVKKNLYIIKFVNSQFLGGIKTLVSAPQQKSTMAIITRLDCLCTSKSGH